MTSVGDNLDRCCYIGNRYHDDDTLDVMLIIFIAQLGYRAFKRGCNKIEEVRPFSRYKQFREGLLENKFIWGVIDPWDIRGTWIHS